MLAAGIGEKLTDINMSLEGKHIRLVYPNIHISTKEAYEHVFPKKPKISIQKVLEEMDILEWKNYLFNDFEAEIFKKHPTLVKLKQQFYDCGAAYASMSGSGSCMFGIFENDPQITFPEQYRIWSGSL